MVLVYLGISCWTLQKLHTNTQSPWRCNLPNIFSIFLRPTALLSIKNYLLPNTNIRTFVTVTLSMSYSNPLSYGILIRAHYLLSALTNKKKTPNPTTLYSLSSNLTNIDVLVLDHCDVHVLFAPSYTNTHAPSHLSIHSKYPIYLDVFNITHLSQ